MPDKINLKEIEKKAYLSYYQDGLLDIFLGIAIISFGIGMATDQSYIGSIMPAILFPLWVTIKKSITIPRIGNVNFSPERKLRIKKETAFFAIFFTVTVIAGAGIFFAHGHMPVWLEAFLKKFIMLPLGIIGAAGLSFLAYWKQMNHFYFLALLTLIFIIVGPILTIRHPVYFISLGVVIFLIGLIMLIKFMGQNPKTNGEHV